MVFFGFLPSDDGGPTPEPSVLKALKEIDPGLRAVWRNHWLDKLTWRALVRQDGTLIDHPRWHIVLRDPDGTEHYLFQVCDEEGDFLPLDHRVPKKILADVARHMDAQQIEAMLEKQRQEAADKKERKFEELRQDMIKANKKRIEQVFEGDNLSQGPSENTRDITIYSYNNQPIRKSGFDAIPTTAKDEGWEIPDYVKEMED